MAESSAPTPSEGWDKKLNLFARLLKAQSDAKKLEVTSTKSDKKNDKFAFDYVSHDDMASEAKRILTKNGILFFPTVDKVEQEENRTAVHVIATFYNVDYPEEKIATAGVGYGVDSSDKGPGKAYSYACKYILAKTLLLNTSDDIEQFDEEFKPAQALAEAEHDVRLWSSNLKKAIENCTSYEELKKIKSENKEMMERSIVPDVTREYFENEIKEKMILLKEQLIEEVAE